MEWASWTLKVLYVLLIFMAGVAFAQLWGGNSFGTIFTGLSIETPSDFVNNKDILIYPDRVVIKVENAKLSNYDSSGSMSPVLDKGMNGIGIKPFSPDEINVGDIVTYRKNGDIIVHRVIEKGVDKGGVYFITKGDNSPSIDGKIRFDDIETILIGLVY